MRSRLTLISPVYIYDFGKSYDFPGGKFGTAERGERVLMYAIVYLQRMVALRALDIPENQLGCALAQLGHHLLHYYQTKQRRVFQFDPSKSSAYKKSSFTFQDLTSWVLNRQWTRSDGKGNHEKLSIQPAKYAKLFDDAIQAQITYVTNSYKGNNPPALWDDCKKKMALASMPPFA